jgi:hypothetical protein
MGIDGSFLQSGLMDGGKTPTRVAAAAVAVKKEKKKSYY